MKQDLLITASYLPQIPVETQPVITRGEIPGGACASVGMIDPRFESLSAKLGLLLASPLILLFYGLLKLFGVTSESDVDLDALSEITDEMDKISEANVYWTEAIKTMIAQGERAREKGQVFTAPDWFIWLQRYGVCITPARLKALMAALSVKGRAVIMGLLHANFVTCHMTPKVLTGTDTSLIGSAGLWSIHALPD